MAHIRVPRGVKGDIPFRLKNRPGGSLVDDFGWTGGTTSGDEWPTVIIKNASDLDVTSSWAIDITPETLPGGAIKAFDPTTGIWRLSTGQYRIRVTPNGAQPLGDYEMTVAFDNSASTAYEETHTLTLIAAGDIEFGDLAFLSVDWSDLTAAVSSSITDPAQQERILAEMAGTVEGDLQACGIDTTQYEEIPLAVRTLLLLYGRVLIFTYDGSAGAIVTEIGELSEKVKFAGKQGPDRTLAEYLRRLAVFCKQNSPGSQPMIGTINVDVGHMAIPDSAGSNLV